MFFATGVFSLRSMANKKEKEQDQNQATHTQVFTQC